MTKELAAIVAGSEPATRVYRELLGAPLVKLLTSGGSGNIGLTGKAVALCAGEGGVALRAEFMGYYEASALTFCGVEQWSTIYGPLHLLSNAAVHWWASTRADDTGLADAALDWLRFWIGFYRLCRTADGGYLTVGARSGGHNQMAEDGSVAGPEGSPYPIPDAAWIGYLAAVAEGEDPGPRLALCKALGLGPAKSWIPPAATALRDSLRAAAADPRPMPAFGLLSPVRIFRDASGAVAAVMDRDVNSNTTPVLGAEYSAGRYQYLPVAGGPHLRERASGATCAREGSELVFRSHLPGYEEQRLALPGGLEEIVIGGVDPQAAFQQPTEQPTSQAPPLAAHSGLGALADRVQALSTTGRDVGKQMLILDDLRKQTPPPASRLDRLADLVMELGVPAEQRAEQKDIVSALRTLASS